MLVNEAGPLLGFSFRRTLAGFVIEGNHALEIMLRLGDRQNQGQ